MKIRQARKEDIDEINRLTLNLHNRLGRLIGVRFAEEELEEELYGERDLEGVYVAEIEGKLAGYIAFSPKPSEDEWCGKFYELYHIVVAEKSARKGVGTRLFEVLLKKAREDNANIRTSTLIKNEGAIRFYQSLGFKPFEISLILDIQKRLPLQR